MALLALSPRQSSLALEFWPPRRVNGRWPNCFLIGGVDSGLGMRVLRQLFYDLRGFADSRVREFPAALL